MEKSLIELERLTKALANRRRLAILRYLKKHTGVSVTEIAEEIKLSLKATSKHLGILAASDILEKDQHGLQMFYRISNNQRPVVKNILSLL